MAVRRVLGLTPVAWVSIAIAITTVVFFGLSLGDIEQFLTAAQYRTAVTAFIFLTLWGAGWLSLELWTLIKTEPDDDHISPTITTLIHKSRNFRAAFVFFVVFALSLIVHLAGWVAW